MRPTTVRDARKLGLLPSVTNVLGVIAKPELVEWKMTQAVLAALTLPRRPGEDEGAFAKRVVEDAQSEVRRAADFGSAFHAGAERVAKTLEVDPAGPYAVWLDQYRAWFQANCVRLVWTERVLVNAELGYAGTADLLMEHQEYGLTLVDYKTQGGPRNTLNTRKGEREGVAGGKGQVANGPSLAWMPRAYPSWCQQLAAYRRAVGKSVACLNLIVNSSEACAPVERVWTEEEIVAGWESFEAALVIWRNEKGYDPRKNGEGPVASGEGNGRNGEGRVASGGEGGLPVLVA
jgi:hypothetical protein